MAAICDSCSWSGMSTAVSYGRCPECGDFIRYDSKPLPTTTQLDIEAFNTRAAKALRGLDGTDDNPFLQVVLPVCEQGLQLTPTHQNGLYKTVLRLADSISDRAVVDFATMNARGY